MIFITVGSQKFQFDRLLKEIDNLKEKNIINDEVFAQVGYSNYSPKNYEYKSFLDREEFNKILKESSLIITHGGTGAIINAIKNNKKVIAVPRLSKYKEHVDNHQTEIVKVFESMNLIFSLENMTDLSSKIEKIREHKFNSYKSNTNKIVKSIDDFVKEI